MSDRLDRHLVATGAGIVLVELFEGYLLAVTGELLDDTHFMYAPSAVLHIVPCAKRARDYMPLCEHERELSILIAVHRRIAMEA